LRSSLFEFLWDSRLLSARILLDWGVNPISKERMMSMRDLQRFILTVSVSAATLALAPWASAGDPVGDYGDAPDVPYPTSFATASSRVGGPGVHHLTTGLEMLGLTVSDEAGASDPLDPDGVPNLINGDSDDGVTSMLVFPAGAPFGVPRFNAMARVTITVAAGAPAGTRYLNVLFDVNADGEWKDTTLSPEWVVVNQEFEVAPGTSQTVFVPFGTITTPFPPPPPDQVWLRFTLTRSPIPEADFADDNGWDGSGAFEFGETEDYTGVELPFDPPDDCTFGVTCMPRVILLDHAAAGFVTVKGWINGADAACCSLTMNGQPTVQALGPMFGLGIVNGALPTDVGVTVGAGGVGPGPFFFITPITPTTHSIGAIQSFSLKHRFSGFDCSGAKVWAASKTCGVLILHDIPGWQIAILPFGLPNQHPPHVPIPLLGPNGETLLSVVFGNDQPTPGQVIVAQQIGGPPVGIEGINGPALPTNTIVIIDFDVDTNLPPDLQQVQTQIEALELTGYDDAMLELVGIDELSLTASRMPLRGNGFGGPAGLMGEAGREIQIDPDNNIVRVIEPFGDGLFVLHGSGPPLCPPDLNGDGVLDFFDVMLFLQLFSAGDSQADWNNDGVFDFFDVLGFLDAFSAGCP
jgi:hypothetical protein